MNSISFTAAFGNVDKTVEITSVHGSGEGGLHLYVGGLYKGIFLKRIGVWEWLPQDEKKDDLTLTDRQILFDKVKEVWG